MPVPIEQAKTLKENADNKVSALTEKLTQLQLQQNKLNQEAKKLEEEAAPEKFSGMGFAGGGMLKLAKNSAEKAKNEVSEVLNEVENITKQLEIAKAEALEKAKALKEAEALEKAEVEELIRRADENQQKFSKNFGEAVKVRDRKTAATKGALTAKPTATPANPPTRLDADTKRQGFQVSEFYKRWANKYKGVDTNFKQEENTIKPVGNSNNQFDVQFKDSHAEENFLRDLAKINNTSGNLSFNGQEIAKLEGGKLMNPLTQPPREFQQGEYAKVVADLKGGKSFDAIKKECQDKAPEIKPGPVLSLSVPRAGQSKPVPMSSPPSGSGTNHTPTDKNLDKFTP